MSQVARSVGFVSANIANTANMPAPVAISGFDVIQRAADTLGIVEIYDGNRSGTLLGRGTINSEVGATATVEFAFPVKAVLGANITLYSANAVIRYV